MTGTCTLTRDQLETLNRSVDEMGMWRVSSFVLTPDLGSPLGGGHYVVKVTFHVVGYGVLMFRIAPDGKRLPATADPRSGTFEGQRDAIPGPAAA